MKKICNHCQETKDISCFDRQSKSIDGYRNICKQCRKDGEYKDAQNHIKYTDVGFLSRLFTNMKGRCKNIPSYQGKMKILDKTEFLQWAVPALHKFIENNNIDVTHGYTNQGISIDKIDDNEGYVIGNLQFLFHYDNIIKGNLEKKKMVAQYSDDGIFVCLHDSRTEAAHWMIEHGYPDKDVRQMKSRITAVVNGHEKKMYGYIWKNVERKSIKIAP